jgi:4'-phosphopantetheinyl transferase
MVHETYRLEHPHLACVGWRLDLEEVARRTSPLDSLLSDDERARLARLKGRAACRFLGSRVLLRTELGRRLSLAPRDVPIRIGVHGKPGLDPACGHLFFNLAHSGDHVLLGMSTRAPIGVDVEMGDRCPQSVARRFPVRERTALARLHGPARRRAFGRLWAAKEACVKCSGRGGSIPAVEVSLEQMGRWRDVRWERIEIWNELPAAIAVQVG